MDRFIPCRSAMDMGYAQSMLTDDGKWKRPAVTTAERDGYQQLLRQAMLPDRSRILAFKPRTPAPVDDVGRIISADNAASSSSSRPPRQRRYIPPLRDRYLVAEELIEDPGLNLMDWGSSNGLTIAQGDAVYLWDLDRADDDAVWEYTKAGEGLGPVTSICWNPDGRHFAQGLNNSDVQVWDTNYRRLVGTLRGAHQSRVGSLAWNDRILSTGGGDGVVVNHDLRVRSHIIHTYRGHDQEVCCLKWSASGKRLASAGADHRVHIWDMALDTRRPSYVHRFEDHRGPLRALAWCPFQSHLLASGGGEGDHRIRLWDTRTGVCLNSLDTGSQVSALLWNPREGERELLTSHCHAQHQLRLWKYPSLASIADLKLPIAHPMYMAQSPDGCTVASAGNWKVAFWDLFGDPKAPPKPKKVENPGVPGSPIPYDVF